MWRSAPTWSASRRDQSISSSLPPISPPMVSLSHLTPSFMSHDSTLAVKLVHTQLAWVTAVQTAPNSTSWGLHTGAVIIQVNKKSYEF